MRWLEIRREPLLPEYWQELQAVVMTVQGQPGSELLDSEQLCFHLPVLEPCLPDSVFGWTVLEPPGSSLLGLGLSVLGLGSPGFELYPGSFAVLVEMMFGQEQLRLPPG